MRKKLDIIQVFRGLAAISVVIHHIIPSLSHFQNNSYGILNNIGAIGKYGVDFFFIISGFIITYSNHLKKRDSVLHYIKNRIVRIYVPYLPIGIAMVLLYNVFPNLSEGGRQISLLTSFTLIPHGNPALAVAWTLSYEMFFYFVFVLYLFNKKNWNIFISVWAFIIFYIVFFNVEFANPILKMITSFYNLEFILGYLLAIFILEGRFRIAKYLVLALIGVSIVQFLNYKFITVTNYHFTTNIYFALFSFLLIYYYCTYKDVKLEDSLLMTIGNATFSIYLIHGPLHVIIERFLPVTNLFFVYILYILVTTIMCIFAGYLYYLVFERKLIVSLKFKLKL